MAQFFLTHLIFIKKFSIERSLTRTVLSRYSRTDDIGILRFNLAFSTLFKAETINEEPKSNNTLALFGLSNYW